MNMASLLFVYLKVIVHWNASRRCSGDLRLSVTRRCHRVLQPNVFQAQAVRQVYDPPVAIGYPRHRAALVIGTSAGAVTARRDTAAGRQADRPRHGQARRETAGRAARVQTAAGTALVGARPARA